MPDSQNPKIHWLYRKLRHHPLLKKTVEKLGPFSTSPPTGWGYKPSGNSARKQAAKSKTTPLILEDAFIRSMKPGTGQVYGLVADSRGIYYDSSGNSDLIHALNTGEKSGWMRHTPDHSETSIPDLISHFCSIKASKYNWYPGDFSSTKRPENPGILIVDQTKGDTALTHGATLPADFDRMVRHALDEHPDKPIYLRSHPDHKYRGKHSCFSPWVFKEKRIKLLPSDISPAECFEFCQEIYTATSLMGMEALLHGKTVKTYGWNFYAGWGLTQDRCKNPHTPRQRTITRERLFEAAYLEYSHYFDPDTGQPCSLSRILQHLELQRKIASENSGTRISVSWDPWKKNLAENFFHTPGNTLIHAENPEIAKQQTSKNPHPKLLLWGARPAPENNKTPILRIEDGFLRSSGLGATFHRPFSWVLDDQGIYFDPTKPSRLETILQTANFTQTELQNAQEITNFLKTNHLSKYNPTTTAITWSKTQANGKKIILIPGQVELDASIKLGSPEIKTNAELLKRTRQENPEAYLIFKAHPDLVANARHGQLLPENAEKIANLVVTDGNIAEWLELCDEVHTMTSTVGFEAILRSIPVRTYGLPFYAGWGLTQDHLTCPRRTRKLTQNQLAAAALIRYPRYLNPQSGEFTTAIQIARLLATAKKDTQLPPAHLRIISLLKAASVKIARR